MNWISVRDETPKNYEDNLLLCIDTGHKTYTTGFYEDDEFVFKDKWHDDYSYTTDITHWARIEPPKEDEPSLDEDDLLYKVIKTEACEKTHKEKINKIKLDPTIYIENIRTLYDVEDGKIIWNSTITYREQDIEIINEDAMTCDGCQEMTMRDDLTMYMATQLSYCNKCLGA